MKNEALFSWSSLLLKLFICRRSVHEVGPPAWWRWSLGHISRCRNFYCRKTFCRTRQVTGGSHVTLTRNLTQKTSGVFLVLFFQWIIIIIRFEVWYFPDAPNLIKTKILCFFLLHSKFLNFKSDEKNNFWKVKAFIIIDFGLIWNLKCLEFRKRNTKFWFSSNRNQFQCDMKVF